MRSISGSPKTLAGPGGGAGSFLRARKKNWMSRSSVRRQLQSSATSSFKRLITVLITSDPTSPPPRHACTAAHAPPGCKKLSFDLWRAAQLEGIINEAQPRLPPAPRARVLVLPSEGLPDGTLISRGGTAAHRMIL